MRCALTLAALGSAIIPSAAVAGPKAYPHKAGVTAEQANADQSACLDAARLAMKNPTAPNPYNPVTQSTVAGAAGAGFAAGFARGIEQGRAYKLTYLNCMESKGYTQRALPSAEWKAIKKLPQAERTARFGVLMTSIEPLHPEMPRDELD